MRVVSLPHFLRFLSLATVICVLELLVVHSVWFPRNAPVLALAVTADLALGIPGLYYLLLVRTRRVPPMSLAPVFIASVLLAQRLLPAAQHTYLAYIQALIPVVEGSILLVGVVKIRGLAQQYRRLRPTTVYATDALEGSFRHIFRSRLFLTLLVTELSIPYYLVFGWFQRYERTNPTHVVVPYHRKSGYGAVVTLFAVLIILETCGLHLIIQHWSSRSAWVVTSVSLYSLLWIIANYQAARLHPIILTPQQLHIRTGLRWSVDVAWTEIVSLQAGTPHKHSLDYVNTAVYGEPQFVLHLKEPVIAYGLLGTRKRVRHIGLTVDDKRLF